MRPLETIYYGIAWMIIGIAFFTSFITSPGKRWKNRNVKKLKKRPVSYTERKRRMAITARNYNVGFDQKERNKILN